MKCVRWMSFGIITVTLLFGGGSEAFAAMKARLAMNLSPISGVTIIAKKKGFFEKHDLNISISNFTSGKQCLNTVVGGAAEIATTAEAPTTAAAMSKLPIAFLARMEYSNLKTLTRAGANISTAADLKGKRIAYTAGSGSEVYTMALLKKAGLTLKDVKATNLRPQDMAVALATGDIDAYNIWEPHVANGLKALGDKAVELDTKGVYAETFNIVVMQDYLKKNPKLIDAFLRALIDAEAWIKSNPEEAITVIAETVNMGRSDLAAIWKDYVYNVVLDDKQVDVLQAHAAWRLSSGNHPAGAVMPDFSSVIFPGPLKKIASERVMITGM